MIFFTQRNKQYFLLGLLSLWGLLFSCSQEDSYEDRNTYVSDRIWREDSLGIEKLLHPPSDSIFISGHLDSLKDSLPLSPPSTPIK